MLELIAAILKSGSASIANLLISTVTVKIIALVTGPTGVGIWSLLRQCQQSAVTIGTSNGNASFVRGINQLEGKARSQFIRTVATTYLCMGGAVVLVMLLLSDRLAVWIGSLNREVILLLSVPVAVGILREYLFSLINGMRAIGRMAVLQIVGPLSALLIAYPAALLVAKNNYSGFILMMLAVALVTSAVAIIFIRRANWEIEFRVSPFWTSESFYRFARLAGVMAVTGIFAMLTLFASRVLIARYRGIDEAGYFDVAWSLGLTYVALVLNAIGAYYLPKLSSMSDLEQVELIRHVAKLAVVGMTPVVVLMILIKSWVVTMFFSSEFLPALRLFQYVLIADYFKMSAWVFSMVVIARGLDKPLLIGSLMWDACLLLGVWGVTRFDLPIGSIGQVLIALHLFGLIGYYRLVKKTLNIHLPRKIWFAWLAGLLCVVVASGLMWNATTVKFSLFWLLIVASLVPLIGMERSELKAIMKSTARLIKR
jgi:PST family polysaccharide transporter